MRRPGVVPTLDESPATLSEVKIIAAKAARKHWTTVLINSSFPRSLCDKGYATPRTLMERVDWSSALVSLCG